jgi:hypothetical protein
MLSATVLLTWYIIETQALKVSTSGAEHQKVIIRCVICDGNVRNIVCERRKALIGNRSFAIIERMKKRGNGTSKL